MAKDGIYSELIERSKSAFRIGLAAYLLGVVLYYAVGCVTGMNARYGRSLLDVEDDAWTVEECMYAAGITFTTIGYTDILGTDRVVVLRDTRSGGYYAENSHDGIVPAPGSPPAETADLEVAANWSVLTILTTVAVSFVGMAVFVYVIGTITAFFVEGAYRDLREVRRALRTIGHLSRHVVVCGAGPTGIHAIARFVAGGTPIVVVDDSEAHIARLRRRFPEVPHLRADPTEYESLETAGIARAMGIVATLDEDNDNLVAIVTAKEIQPGLRVVSQASDVAHAARFRRAGSAEVVVPPVIGGMRIASEAVRPTAVDLLDGFLGHEEDGRGFRFLGLTVPEGGAATGRTLAESRIDEETGIHLLALRRRGEPGFTYNPGPGTILEEGATLAVVADEKGLASVRARLGFTAAATGAFRVRE